MVADQVCRKLKWMRVSEIGNIKMSDLTIFNAGFLDAYKIDEETLRGLMVAATEKARQRDRTKTNTNKKRKTDSFEPLNND